MTEHVETPPDHGVRSEPDAQDAVPAAADSADSTGADTTSEPTRRPNIEWHPDAVRPPFDWRVRLPTDWALVETHPARWKRQNERIVDDYFAGRRVPAKVRNQLMRALADVVAAAQRNKVLLTLLKPGLDDQNRIANIALSVMFTSSSPRLSSMAPIKRAFDSTDSFKEMTTPSGNAYGLVSVRRRQRDDGELRDVLSVQGFYPLAGTVWTLAVSATTSRLDMEEALRDTVIRCVASVRWGGDSEGSSDLAREGAPAAATESSTPDEHPFAGAIDLVGYAFER
ncbi:hypothetical protein GCM10009624_29000 [Gordonia sinesedis]